MLTELSPEEPRVKTLRAAYSKIVKVVDGMDQDDQRVVLLAAASDFTLDSLLEKSRQSVGYGPRLGARDKVRIAEIRREHGDAEATKFETMLLWSKTATKGKNGKA
ncbi:MAG: hypothetical protein IID37_10290 [Planctomycetes bacterium]|nr:hypothetical protein [Planctomycetota bacterium]